MDTPMPKATDTVIKLADFTKGWRPTTSLTS